MNNYNITKHYKEDGQTLEDLILNYFDIYLDINNNYYD